MPRQEQTEQRHGEPNVQRFSFGGRGKAVQRIDTPCFESFRDILRQRLGCGTAL
ncbi:hypothetical protein GCM10011395_29710 [Sphingomonas psychrolutea]|uniref:Uncharacterized protein n=1 Tax=Sphingomonas psychrolutea TaxID=1259676 RepID=A0ABQ1H3A0_9SPHN|nr:hypothetical protein GCM10011395_29710 [Sphingomonas psychrolutea]